MALPRCKNLAFDCLFAILAEVPGHSSSILPSHECDKHSSLRDHEAVDAVIQDIQHSDEAAAVDPVEAATVVATQWAQQVELNLGADVHTPNLLVKLVLLSFTRHPVELHTALLEGPELQSCREQMKEHPCKLDCGALVFVEPFQYTIAIDAAIRHEGRLAVHHVITSERFEPNIMQAVRGLKSRLNVRVRSKQTIFEPHAVEVVRTFLNVPERALRSIASVTHSTTSDAYGFPNPRTV